MAVATRPHEIAHFEIAYLRHHVGQQGVGRNVERDAEENIGAALIQLAGQAAVSYVELKQRVAGRECHRVDFARIPRGNDVPS